MNTWQERAFFALFGGVFESYAISKLQFLIIFFIFALLSQNERILLPRFEIWTKFWSRLDLSGGLNWCILANIITQSVKFGLLFSWEFGICCRICARDFPWVELHVADNVECPNSVSQVLPHECLPSFTGLPARKFVRCKSNPLQNSNVHLMSHVLPPRCLYSPQVYQDKHKTMTTSYAMLI